MDPSIITRPNHRNILRIFPWDTCRRIYADPTNDQEYCLFGVSYDWEHLLSASFVDAKTLIREWLLIKRNLLDEHDSDTFVHLAITSTEEKFRLAVFARTVLYRDYNFFGMLAMAYLYLCGLSSEENNVFALFCSLSYAESCSDDPIQRKDAGQDDEPHWTILARWLRSSWDDLFAYSNKNPLLGNKLLSRNLAPSATAPDNTDAELSSSDTGNSRSKKRVRPSGGSHPDSSWDNASNSTYPSHQCRSNSVDEEREVAILHSTDGDGGGNVDNCDCIDDNALVGDKTDGCSYDQDVVMDHHREGGESDRMREGEPSPGSNTDDILADPDKSQEKVSTNHPNPYMSPMTFGMRDGFRTIAQFEMHVQQPTNPYSDQLTLSNLLSQNLRMQYSPARTQSSAVNRRQKKNRDKFRFTFQLSGEQAASLVRSQLIHRCELEPALHDNANPGDKLYRILVPLKGIDVLANGRYRVQLNTFRKGRKKFSRNSVDLYEALWIFEIALLISDCPSHLSELQRIGNYHCLSPLGFLGFFSSASEYYLELGRHVLRFYDMLDFFSEDLILVAVQPSFEGPRKGTDNSTPLTGNWETMQPLWMAGFHRALSLRDQQLSCLYCFRSMDLPGYLPRISMLRDREEKQVSSGLTKDEERNVVGVA